MQEKSPGLTFPDKGARTAPESRELRIFGQAAIQEGGTKEMPAAARKFSRRFSSAVTHYPEPYELPNWLRAMIEKKSSVEELAKTLHDRLHRAPSEENQELALLLANEIARMKGGSEVLGRYTTPELLARLTGKGGEEK